MQTKKTTTKTFPKGGVHPHDNKLAQDARIEPIGLPPLVAIPLAQHIGAPATPLIKPLDKVKVGQLIAKAEGFISANIHSSVSGTVRKFNEVLDISGYRKKAVIIAVEGDEWEEGINRSDTLKKEITASKEEIINRVKEAGIVGLGGATFPSHIKLMPPKEKPIEFLIINGAECEPYLTSDYRLMLERGEEIIIGVRILLKALGIAKAMVGIEDNKIEAIEHLQKIAKDYPEVEIYPLKTQYPQGGERQIVKALTNREIPPPPKGLPMDVGCAVFNIATTCAVYDAVQKNKPLVERVVTLTGKSLKQQKNYLTRFGTPLNFLLENAGASDAAVGKILAGGPMMGKALSTPDIPVTKGISGVVLVEESESHRKEALNCIRCAKCVSACPLGLEPYLLMAFVEKNMLDSAEERRILSCCECGCCSFVCPANRPLLDYLKLGKTTILKLKRTQKI